MFDVDLEKLFNHYNPSTVTSSLGYSSSLIDHMLSVVIILMQSSMFYHVVFITNRDIVIEFTVKLVSGHLCKLDRLFV